MHCRLEFLVERWQVTNKMKEGYTLRRLCFHHFCKLVSPLGLCFCPLACEASVIGYCLQTNMLCRLMLQLLHLCHIFVWRRPFDKTTSPFSPHHLSYVYEIKTFFSLSMVKVDMLLAKLKNIKFSLLSFFSGRKIRRFSFSNLFSHDSEFSRKGLSL